jgi:hypothetical protein
MDAPVARRGSTACVRESWDIAIKMMVWGDIGRRQRSGRGSSVGLRASKGENFINLSIMGLILGSPMI